MSWNSGWSRLQPPLRNGNLFKMPWIVVVAHLCVVVLKLRKPLFATTEFLNTFVFSFYSSRVAPFEVVAQTSNLVPCPSVSR
jgi:hypothetical protein